MSNTTTTTLLDAINTLPRYAIDENDTVDFVKLVDVVALVKKGITLEAPLVRAPEPVTELICGCIIDDYQTLVLCDEHVQ